MVSCHGKRNQTADLMCVILYRLDFLNISYVIKVIIVIEVLSRWLDIG